MWARDRVCILFPPALCMPLQCSFNLKAVAATSVSGRMAPMTLGFSWEALRSCIGRVLTICWSEEIILVARFLSFICTGLVHSNLPGEFRNTATACSIEDSYSADTLIFQFICCYNILFVSIKWRLGYCIQHISNWPWSFQLGLCGATTTFVEVKFALVLVTESCTMKQSEKKYSSLNILQEKGMLER